MKRRFRPVSPREVPRFAGVSTFLRLPTHSGFDLVEVSPAYDSSGITSLLASALLAEFLAAFAATLVRRRKGRLPAGRVPPRLPSAGTRRPRRRRR